MFFEKVVSEGLAHNSYVFGDDGEAVVIDPRRDPSIYFDICSAKNARIKFILETHRNEDYVVGSREILDRRDPTVFHADSQFDYSYGNEVAEGDEFRVGDFLIKAIETPGHTPGSMSYLLYDRNEDPWIIFTGDALFAGDVGRTDLLGEEMIEEMTEILYESIYEKILPLGDEVLVCPAHGSGSACGASISDREWTTIGMERKRNPLLQVEDKDSFVEKAGRKLEIPTYFRKMEELNLDPPVLKRPPSPTPLKPGEFKDRINGAQVLDTRKELEFGSAHIENSISIMSKNLSRFGGWFLDYEKPIFLVTYNVEKNVRKLIRMGFDNIPGYLSGGLLKWHINGFPSSSIDTLTVQQLCRRIEKGKVDVILDVRSEKELNNKGRIKGAIHTHLTELPEKTDKIPKEGNLYIFCGTGIRSMTAASILKREGFKNLNVVLGGLAGWSSKTKNLIEK